jgi:predicted ester cyclase
VDALNRGLVEEYLRSFSAESLRWVDGIDAPISLTEVDSNLRHLLSAFEGLHLAEELLFGTDRYVCAHWRMTGRHVGEYYGIAPSRREIDVRLCEVYEFDAGRAVTTWVHGDPTVLFRQIDESVPSGRLQ